MTRTLHTLMASVLLIAGISLIISCDKDDDDKNNQPPVVENLNPGTCDAGLNLEVTEVLHAFQAVDICKLATGTDGWGLITASFIRASDTEISPNNQYGIMGAFGEDNAPTKGSRMLVMSTGRARTPTQANACGSTACGGTGLGVPPVGIPTNVPGCIVTMNIYDDVGLKLTLRVPSTATGFSIDHNFFTFDYPEFVCSAFNDQFVILVDPAPSGAVNKNVAIDSLSNPMGVNTVLLQGSNSSLLTQTGFGTWGDAAATGWVRTTVPVTAGSTITIRMLIYDLGDNASDSSVLIDNFQWLTGTVALNTRKL